MAPGPRAPRRGLPGPIGLLGLERKAPEEGDLCGEAEAMAGAMAGRHSGSGLRPDEDLAKAGGSHPRSAHGYMCVLGSIGLRGRAADACAGARRTTAGRREPVGAFGVATTGGAPHGLPREQACGLNGERRLHTQGGKPTPLASPRLTTGGTPASAAGTAQNEEKGDGFTPCERGRARAWAHRYTNGTCGARVRSPAPRPSLHLRARCCRVLHMQKCIPARHEGRASHSVTAQWRSGTSFQPLARWPGFTEERSGRSSPEWPWAEVQASVKMGGAARRREGRRRQRGDMEAKVGALGDGWSGSSHGWLRSPRRTAFPRAASNSSFFPLLLLLRRVGVWAGEWIP
jgi:hypothetical protein